jgi:hypothetical protein
VALGERIKGLFDLLTGSDCAVIACVQSEEVVARGLREKLRAWLEPLSPLFLPAPPTMDGGFGVQEGMRMGLLTGLFLGTIRVRAHSLLVGGLRRAIASVVGAFGAALAMPRRRFREFLISE